MLTIGSLFAGIGGLERGLERESNGTVKWQVEISDYCRAVLAKHWPLVDRSVCDVKAANASNLSRVDLICGGFPCQGNSSAGKGLGLKDPRSALWFEFRRIVEELTPALVVVENVNSGVQRWLPHVRRDLHVLGYRTRAFKLSAFNVGAPHRRERVFVLAANTERAKLRNESRWSGGTNGQREEGSTSDTDSRGQSKSGGFIRSFWRWSSDGDSQVASDTNSTRLEERREQPSREERTSAKRGCVPVQTWSIESPICGVAHGVPGRIHRIRALGNSVSPECSAAIGRVITHEVSLRRHRLEEAGENDDE